jgi:hypothetical protein
MVIFFAGSFSEPSRKPISWAPRIGGSTCAFRSRKLFLVSFSATPWPSAGEKGERELEEVAIGDDKEESL